MLNQTIIFVSILAFLTAWLLLRVRIRYWCSLLMERGWKSTINYDRCYKAFSALFEGLDGYKISLDERNQKQIQDTSLTYGEVVFYSFVQILEMAKIKPSDTFYDLGSGIGKAVFIASMVFDCKKACGVEKLQSLYDTSNSVLTKLNDSPELLELLPGKTLQIQFIHNDLLHESITDADVVFINATCYQGELWQQIQGKLLQLKAGARLIVTTKILDIGGFVLQHQNFYLMSWDLCRVSIYERI